MVRSKWLVGALILAGVCAFTAPSFAAKAKCGFNGDYSFFFWDPSTNLSGVGFFSVQLNPNTKCRSGVVLPGGIINCNFDSGDIFEDFIEDGGVFLESDGEGTMEIETNSSNGICGTGKDAIELDISLVNGASRFCSTAMAKRTRAAASSRKPGMTSRLPAALTSASQDRSPDATTCASGLRTTVSSVTARSASTAQAA